jgi:hypothetical protein
VNRADFDIALLAQIIAAGLDIVRRATEGNENRFRVGRLVFGDQAVTAAGQAPEFLVGVLEELEDRLVEIVAAGHDAVHVMLLVLHRAEQDGILQVHHFRHAAAFGPEQFALRRAWGSQSYHPPRREIRAASSASGAR